MSLDCYRLGAGYWSQMLCQVVHHQEGCTRGSAVLLLVVWYWGQSTRIAPGVRRSSPYEFGALGQVGQESNL